MTNFLNCTKNHTIYLRNRIKGNVSEKNIHAMQLYLHRDGFHSPFPLNFVTSPIDNDFTEATKIEKEQES